MAVSELKHSKNLWTRLSKDKEVVLTLVTGNQKHYPKEKRRGVQVLSPADYILCLSKRFE